MAKKDSNLMFDFFRHADIHDMDFIDTLTDEEVKSLSPYVMTMWLNGASKNREANVYYCNAYMNDKVFKLGKHPRLLLNLFMTSVLHADGCGRLSFVKATGGGSVDLSDVAYHLEMQPHEVSELMAFGILTETDVKEIKELYKDC